MINCGLFGSGSVAVADRLDNPLHLGWSSVARPSVLMVIERKWLIRTVICRTTPQATCLSIRVNKVS